MGYLFAPLSPFPLLCAAALWARAGKLPLWVWPPVDLAPALWMRAAACAFIGVPPLDWFCDCDIHGLLDEAAPASPTRAAVREPGLDSELRRNGERDRRVAPLVQTSSSVKPLGVE